MTRYVRMSEFLARAAAKDAANRSMRDHNRTEWNEDDYRVAVEEFDRLWPVTVSPHTAHTGR